VPFAQLQRVFTSENARVSQLAVKLRPTGAQNCALQLFRDRDLELNHMTLKLEGDQDILKMYLRIENESARLWHSELRA